MNQPIYMFDIGKKKKLRKEIENIKKEDKNIKKKDQKRTSRKKICQKGAQKAVEADVLATTRA